MSSKQRIRFYSSVEEMEQASIASALSQTPIERIRETVELILRVYNVTREELAGRPKSRRITFNNPR
jgi:hypothetical protein